MSETQENYKMAKRILTPAPDTEGEREGYRPRYEPAPAGWTMMEADRKNRRSLWLCEDGVKDWFYWDAPIAAAAITTLQSAVEWWKQEYRTAHDMWELKADKCSELQADYDAVQEAYSRCQSQAEASIAERLKSERIERDTRQVYNFALTTIKAQRAEIERWKKATAFEEGQVDADQATIAALKSALEEVCATYTTYSGNKGVSMYNAARLALAKDVK
jgi:hypothetical protein